MKFLFGTLIFLSFGFAHADSKRCLHTGVLTPQGIAENGKLCVSMEGMMTVEPGEAGKIRISLFDKEGASVGVDHFNYAVKVSVGNRSGISFIQNRGEAPFVTILEDIDQSGRETASPVGVIEIGKRTLVILKDQSL